MASLDVRAGFPADPTSAWKARRFLAETLRGWQCEHLVDVATLLVSELVANAILHAGTTLEVAARITPDRVRIEVYDDNPRLPVRKHYSTLSGTGRGLLLVEKLAEDWGWEAASPGKRVWFELAQTRSGDPKDAADLFAFADLDTFDLDDLDDIAPAPPRPSSPRGRAPTSGSRRRPRVVVHTSR